MNLDNVKSKKILSPTTYLKTFIILNTKKVKSVWKDTSHKNLMTKCKKCHCHNYNSYRKCRGFRSIHLASFTVHQIKGMWVWTGLVFVLRLNTIWVLNIELRLDLGYRLLRFTSRTNLELVPWFAKICFLLDLLQSYWKPELKVTPSASSYSWILANWKKKEDKKCIQV